MLNEERAQSQDLQMMGMLLPLGIEKGKDFKPDVATVARLNSAQQKRMLGCSHRYSRSSRTCKERLDPMALSAQRVCNVRSGEVRDRPKP
jgi:hypothetical protein